MNSCLLVIDAQQSFKHRPYFSQAGMPAYLAAQNAIIAHFEQSNRPIVRVFHSDGPDEVGNPWSLSSGLVVPLAEVKTFSSALTITKNRHSAFVGTALPVWLTTNKLTDLFITGIRTEQCCETTTRHGFDLGYNMHFVTDATMTWDIPFMHSSGSQVTLKQEQIKERTEAVLIDRFAKIMLQRQACELIG
jgi:nicotinamidase-related amidase